MHCVNVLALAKCAYTQPQAAYTGFVLALQNEWTHLSRVVPNVGPLLAPIEVAIREPEAASYARPMPMRWMCSKHDSGTCSPRCKVGGLVHCRHNDITREFGFLCSQAVSNGATNYEPRPMEDDAAASTAESATQQHQATDGSNPAPVTTHEDRGGINSKSKPLLGEDALVYL